MILYKLLFLELKTDKTGLYFYYEETFCKYVLNLHLKIIFREEFENGYNETTIELKYLGKNLTFHSTLNPLNCNISVSQFFLPQLPLLGPY